MLTIGRIYNGVLDYCISNRQIKLEIRRKEKEVKGNLKAEEKLATEFLKKAKGLSGERGLKVLEEYGLYSEAADRLVGVIMSMAISDSLYSEESNKPRAYPQF